MAPDGMSFDSEKDLTPGRLRDLGKRVREGLLTSRNGGIALAVLLALAALAWGPLLLRRARGKIREDAGRRWERRVRRSLRRAGVEAPAVRTLPEVAARAAAAGHPAAPRVEELAVSLDRLRWSPAPDVEAEVSRIRALLRHLPRRRSAAGGDDVQLSS
ncbi:MAG: hypothetical protein FJ098_17330 [Deltaproteobacteria bacterium]|nr:hypothetical protein [Deltaproteobacteria bacterium]